MPLTASADTSKIRFGVVSDIHYLAPSLKGEGKAWDEFVYNKHKEYNDLDSLVDNALDGVLRNAVEGGENYLLIPGDLTKDGELESHKVLAERLEAFEAETGIPVFVIPGNHDINNSNAITFENGYEEPAEKTSPEQFREIYKNLGFDMADSFFVPESGKKGGMLSYACTLGGYRLIAIDSCMYSADNGAEGDEHMTDGRIADGLLEWMIDDISSSDAKWKIVVLHKALYSNGSHYDDGEVEGMRAQLGALLPYLGVDMVLQGHDHVYMRTDVLNANSVIPTKTGTKTYNGVEYLTKYNPNGTVYSICGTSGVKVYHTKDAAATDEKFPRAEALADVENSMFSAITVDGSTLYYNAYEVENGKATAVDTFAIEKTDNSAPVDKFGNGFANLLSNFNVGFMWQVTNFFLGIIGKFMNLVWNII